MYRDKKIKVLQAIRQGQVGGGETHILNLVKNLDKLTFEPIVLSFTGGQMIEELNRNSIQNYIIPSGRAFDVFKWKKVLKLLQREQIDIVHVHGTRANSNVYWAAKTLGLPIIYTIHGWSFHDDQSWLVKKIRISFERWITKKVNFNISVSASNQETGYRNISRFHSQVINNGIDLTLFNPKNHFRNVRKELNIPNDKCVIGFIARMTAQKDPITLLYAFKKVLEENNDVILLMVGDGDLKEQVVQLAKELNIESQVIFERFRTDVPDMLNAVDIFCLPSLWEGLPIGLLEAMAMCKAVIATSVDGSKEIISNNENGILIPPGQPEVLAQSLLKLVNDKALRDKLSFAARHTVIERYDIGKMARKIEQIYINMLTLN